MIERYVIYGVLGAFALTVAAGIGYHQGVKQLWDYQVEQAKEAVKVVVKIEKIKETILVPYLKRETVIQTVFQTIEKETNDAPSRPTCNATHGWVQRHDAAADGEDRRDGRGVDVQADSGIGEITAQGVVVRNYKAFHQVANDLKSCREFVIGINEVK